MGEISTPRGPARVAVDRPAGVAGCLLLLGHGAGGDVTTPDLLAVRDAAVAAGAAVALVTQPYRVAGRRSPPPAPHLDEAWTAIVHALAADWPGVPLVFGGRSSGARVACRTAAELGAVGVVALAFPLHPPGRPDKSRAGELPAAVPTLVVNGDRDPFGVPPASAPNIDLVVRPGERHDLRKDPAAVAIAVVDWLTRHGWVADRSDGA
jgi:predicted alpha/beta-hydrolase family hydrolase